jgi:hypothetical protein
MRSAPETRAPPTAARPKAVRCAMSVCGTLHWLPDCSSSNIDHTCQWQFAVQHCFCAQSIPTWVETALQGMAPQSPAHLCHVQSWHRDHPGHPCNTELGFRLRSVAGPALTGGQATAATARSRPSSPGRTTRTAANPTAVRLFACSMLSPLLPVRASIAPLLTIITHTCCTASPLRALRCW